ncbi:MAG: Co2+/Mg2+ efflux protein ApaG [Muricauda sp.]|uniref:Co2+/Mg2+ efflux protein ApaG n=1 Tax=Flagellimonas lutaonensis TaxID=516051 RepID=UPI0005F80804|nr:MULTISPECIES: Co2+/Mg2+ efflux protein ApaG [Allomuricauda]MBC32111.1 Co2+/Mg2+ efflux protein ApaG [Allomuricauda sp.]|tara:strand:+ start:3150 stop:3536 length:387 start_codon:yes stop_codon:yes gene_type:complete
MITQVTKGIKVSVQTSFEGTFFKNYKMHYAFGYTITIENQSKDVVQLTARHWDIFDSLKEKETVDGEGVIGKKPVIQPGKSHTYSSGCLLASPIGAMRGFYHMVNFSSGEEFEVEIPTFKFAAPFAMN